MSLRSTAVVALIAVGQLLTPDRAWAQTSLDDAARLTWRLETRATGVAALRTLVAAEPDNASARFELGRVLTWDVKTRPEGIELIRDVLEQQPRPDVEEALAEVLGWNQASRGEAVRRLRNVVEREPARVSARLKLAEVLSWNADTRDESRALYAAVLRDDEASVEAAVGLARVLSWSGRIPESRAWYQLALVRNPEAQGARIGIAEMEGWNGRARASLKTLLLPSGQVIDTPDALRLRAQAYSQLGRPARALDQYERLLALDPGNTVALDASRNLRRQVRPSLEIGTELSTESGDPSSTRVETASVPFRFSFHPQGRDTEIAMTWAHASYRNSRGSIPDRLIGAGVDAPIGNRVRLSGDLTAHSLSGAEGTFTGKGQMQLALHDAFDLRVGVAREQLSSSRLSLAGEWVDGTFYGPSFVNQATLALGARAKSWDVWASGTAGEIRGTGIANNARKELFAGGGRTFHPGGVTLRPGYSLAWMSYDLDLGAFPGETGGDGVTAPGVGGYFSPSRFLNHMARVDVTVPIGESVVMVGGAGYGRQRVEDAWSRGTAVPWVESSDAVFGLRARLGDRMSIGGQASYQNVAAAFDRTAIRITLGYGF